MSWCSYCIGIIDVLAAPCECVGDETTSPIFNSNAVFTVLTLTIALSVYLRSIHVDAGKRIEEIISDVSHKGWPFTAVFTEPMLAHLEDVRRRIERITPKLFGYLLALSARTIIYGVCGLFAFEWLLFALSGIDIVLSFFLLVGIIMMRKDHDFLRIREGKLRDEMIAYHQMERSKPKGKKPSQPDAKL